MAAYVHRQGIQSPEEKRWVLRADLKDSTEEEYQESNVKRVEK